MLILLVVGSFQALATAQSTGPSGGSSGSSRSISNSDGEYEILINKEMRVKIPPPLNQRGLIPGTSYPDVDSTHIRVTLEPEVLVSEAEVVNGPARMGCFFHNRHEATQAFYRDAPLTSPRIHLKAVFVTCFQSEDPTLLPVWLYGMPSVSYADASLARGTFLFVTVYTPIGIRRFRSLRKFFSALVLDPPGSPRHCELRGHPFLEPFDVESPMAVTIREVDSIVCFRNEPGDQTKVFYEDRTWYFQSREKRDDPKWARVASDMTYDEE